MNKTIVDTPAIGFTFPVGPRDGGNVLDTHKCDSVFLDAAYHKHWGVWHPGEDWNGKGGGNTDLGHPVYSIADGVVEAASFYRVWGNIVLIRHELAPGRRVWSQYAHLDEVFVEHGQPVRINDQIGTIGRGEGDRFPAHLHFEIRLAMLPPNQWKPLVLDREQVKQHYADPTAFIRERLTADG